jgi:hypothetical protein
MELAASLIGARVVPGKIPEPCSGGRVRPDAGT